VVASAPVSTAAPLETRPRRSPECERTCGAACVMKDGAPVCPKECQSSDECAADELCIFTRMIGGRGARRACIASECECVDDDVSCGPDLQCVYAGNLGGGIYHCVAVGKRRRGEACSMSLDRDQACARGLICRSGECAPKTCETDADCGLGAGCHLIAGGDEEKSCAPECRGDADCPPEAACLDPERTGVSLCYRRDRLGCFAPGATCEAGTECKVVGILRWAFSAECRRPCAEDGACAAGQICGDQGYCLDRCSETRPCAERYDCGWTQRAADPRTPVRACLGQRAPLPPPGAPPF